MNCAISGPGALTPSGYHEDESGTLIAPTDRLIPPLRRELAEPLHWLATELRAICLVPCGWSGFLPPCDPLARFATAQEENTLHDPSHSDLLFAIWTVLALPDPEGDPGIDDEVLHELYDDLHLDLQRAQRPSCDEETRVNEDWAEYEELAIALP